MRPSLIISSILLLALIIFQVNSCSDDNNGITEPNIPDSVEIAGAITYENNEIDFQNSVILLGGEEIQPDEKGKFNLQSSGNLPALIILTDNQGNPLLLSLVPNPPKNASCNVDVHSTALSLVFINPFICNTDPPTAEAITDRIQSLPEFTTLKNLLEQLLNSNINSLSEENDQLGQAINNVVIAYLNSVSPIEPVMLDKKASAEAEIIISPLSIRSGHQIQHLGEMNFTISNWYGRWAKCITPDDTLFLPPNDGFIDFIKGTPWAPSQRNFELEIIPNEDPKEVLVYGLGLNNEESTPYQLLTDKEKEHVIFTGKMTVLIEFLPRVLSLFTNFPFTFGNKDVAAETVGNIIRWAVQYDKNFERSKLLLSNGDYFGFYYEMLKEYLSLIVTDDNFRDFILTAAKVTLSETAFKALGKYLLLPLNVLYIGDDLTGLAKSVIALNKSSLKTSFKIYSEEFKFGNVNGNVIDLDEDGIPIQGAVVQLTGDENNPMNPNYIYTTDGTGGFWFENILEGEKALIASKDGYGSKTVAINVSDQKTTEVTIGLSKKKGVVQGKIINEVYQKNNFESVNFDKDCYFKVVEIGGNNFNEQYWIWASKKGEFSLELTPGTYVLSAWHENYYESSVTVSITGNETTTAENIILKPKCSLYGTIYYDINFDGSYEYQYDFKSDTTGSTKISDVGDCRDGTDRIGIAIVGISSTEIFELIIDTSQVTAADHYSMGDLVNCGCPGVGGKSTAILLTKRFQCTHPEYGYSQDLVFGLTDLNDDIPCNCGIVNPGDLYISEFSTKIGDVIDGSLVVELPGWKGCHCACCDDEGNYIVDCAKVRLNLYFKVVVGSLYDGMISTSGINQLIGNN